ncbi:hypothetical protein [Zavarzinella formosa]|uniref:hypothetical protein n=1 Tax=Zavarzinella formosa TaxID=360055 RepID=UPI0012FC976E|nr:hypothetical protein [Zavarzinella formosa]
MKRRERKAKRKGEDNLAQSLKERKEDKGIGNQFAISLLCGFGRESSSTRCKIAFHPPDGLGEGHISDKVAGVAAHGVIDHFLKRENIGETILQADSHGRRFVGLFDPLVRGMTPEEFAKAGADRLDEVPVKIVLRKCPLQFENIPKGIVEFLRRVITIIQIKPDIQFALKHIDAFIGQCLYLGQFDPPNLVQRLALAMARMEKPGEDEQHKQAGHPAANGPYPHHKRATPHEPSV